MSTLVDCNSWHGSCKLLLYGNISSNKEKLIAAIKHTFKIYGVAHLVPALLFKWKDLKNEY